MSQVLADRIAACLKNNASDAVNILKEHGGALDAADLKTLVETALNENADNIAEFYPIVIGRADANLQQDLHGKLNDVTNIEKLVEVLMKDEVTPFHSAILDAIEVESMDDSEIVAILIGVDNFTDEHKVRVGRAVGIDDEPDTSLYQTTLSVAGRFMDDATMLRFVNWMNGTEDPPEDDELNGNEPDGEGGEVGEKP